MTDKKVMPQTENHSFTELSKLIEETQQTLILHANSTLTMLFLHIGNRINQNILQNKRAGYGKQIVVTLSRQLTEKYARNFEESNWNQQYLRPKFPTLVPTNL